MDTKVDWYKIKKGTAIDLRHPEHPSRGPAKVIFATFDTKDRNKFIDVAGISWTIREPESIRYWILVEEKQAPPLKPKYLGKWVWDYDHDRVGLVFGKTNFDNYLVNYGNFNLAKTAKALEDPEQFHIYGEGE